MATTDLSVYDKATIPNAKDFRFGIVVSEWNDKITEGLFQGTAESFTEALEGIRNRVDVEHDAGVRLEREIRRGRPHRIRDTLGPDKGLSGLSRRRSGPSSL